MATTTLILGKILSLYLLTAGIAFIGLLAVLVTLTGLSFIVRGVTYYWIPRLVLKPSETRATSLRIFGAAFTVFGGFMGYLSFLA
jgi:hypothetical protein